MKFKSHIYDLTTNSSIENSCAHLRNDTRCVLIYSISTFSLQQINYSVRISIVMFLWRLVCKTKAFAYNIHLKCAHYYRFSVVIPVAPFNFSLMVVCSSILLLQIDCASKSIHTSSKNWIIGFWIVVNKWNFACNETVELNAMRKSDDNQTSKKAMDPETSNKANEQ